MALGDPRLRRRRRPWTRWAFFGAGGVVIAILAVAAFIALAQGVAPGGSAVKSLACSPQPCLDVQDYTLWVSNVSVAQDIVRMDITFRNSSAATHADPADLQLVDANHQSWRSVQDAPGCTHWTRTEFSNGAKLGPLTICFRTAAVASPLTLRWAPDMGLFCCEADLKIR
jgi:hypothetical protein